MSNKFLIFCRTFWKNNDQKILIFLAIIVVSLASFRAGQTEERKRQTSDIKISLTRPESSNPQKNKEKLIEKVTDVNSDKISLKKENLLETEKSEKKCLYVGSKNSNKYHLPTCRYAQNIKPENKKCFASQEEAEKAGYIGGNCCVNKK